MEPTIQELQVNPHSTQRTLLVARLTALWALSEVVLGGVLHGLRLPVTGMVVGGTAVICICLVGRYSTGKGQVLRATLVVLIIKAMLAPHSPLPAYLAVLFQGAIGELFLQGRSYFKLRCMAVGIVGLVESAVQKLLMLTLVFGVVFWEALEQFISKVLGIFGAEPGPYSYYLVGAYVLAHVVAGALAGIIAYRLPKLAGQYRNASIEIQPAPAATDEPAELSARKKKRGKKVRGLLLFIWLVLGALLIQGTFYPENAWLPAGETIALLLRSMVVVLTWYLLVAPVALRFFRKWLQRKEGALKEEVEAVLLLLHATSQLISQCWKQAAGPAIFPRVKTFLRLLMVHVFPEETLPEN